MDLGANKVDMVNSPIKRTWWKQGLRFLFFAFVILVTLLGLAASWISWQGRREWSETKKELLARGEKLSLIELAPPPVPDAENFFADPMWTELQTKVSFLPDGSQHTDWFVPPDKWQLALLKAKPSEEEVVALKQKFPAFEKADFTTSRIDIARKERYRVMKSDDAEERNELPGFTMAVLEPLVPLMAKIADLQRRPAARAPVRYEDGFFAALEHLEPLLRLGQGLQFRTLAEIQLRQEQAAAADIFVIITLSRTLETEPFLISQLVRYALLSLAIRLPLEEGITAHVWTDAELQDFERNLQKEDLISGFIHSLRSERGSFNQTMEMMYGNNKFAFEEFRVTYGMRPARDEGTWWQRSAEAVFNLPKSSRQRNTGESAVGGYVAIFGPGDQAFYNRWIQREIEKIEAVQSQGFSSGIKDGAFDELPKDIFFKFRHMIGGSAMASFSSSIKKAAATQDMIVQARLACALERYYLVHNEYPASLEALVQEYFSSLPVDVVTLQPMRYERTARDQFRLWGIGWDGKDDNGRAPESQSSNDGDWVWGQKKWTW